MFEPNQYRELCSELHVSEEKLEEVIQMTEQEKKRKFHRPMRLGLVAAAVAAMLVVTVSAANSEAIMTYLTSLRDAAVAGEAWADSPVNTEEGTGGLCLPEASLEERDGRTILIVDGVETDVTQALTDQGEYLYECGEGEEQAQVRVYLDEQGAPRLMTSFFTAGEDGGTGAVVVVPADGEEEGNAPIELDWLLGALRIVDSNNLKCHTAPRKKPGGPRNWAAWCYSYF